MQWQQHKFILIWNWAYGMHSGGWDQGKIGNPVALCRTVRTQGWCRLCLWTIVSWETSPSQKAELGSNVSPFQGKGFYGRILKHRLLFSCGWEQLWWHPGQEAGMMHGGGISTLAEPTSWNWTGLIYLHCCLGLVKAEWYKKQCTENAGERQHFACGAAVRRYWVLKYGLPWICACW